jgi:hypothetical protein
MLVLLLTFSGNLKVVWAVYSTLRGHELFPNVKFPKNVKIPNLAPPL